MKTPNQNETNLRPIPPPPNWYEPAMPFVKTEMNYGIQIGEYKDPFENGIIERPAAIPKKKDPRTFIGWAFKAFFD